MILQGITGTGSGKMGTAIFYVSSGEQIVRQHQPNVSNPSTPAQMSQRAKLKLIQQLGCAFDSIIAMPKKGLLRPRNLFASRNIDIVHAYSDHVEIDYEHIQLTAGSVAFPHVIIENVGISSINIRLAEAPGASVSRVVYSIFKKSSENGFYLVGSHILDNAGEGGLYPLSIAFLPSDVVVYAYGIKDRDFNSTARFGSYHVANGEDIASLVMSRMMSTTEYRFTRTTAATLFYEYIDLPYGVEFDTEDPSPTLRRLGNSRLHAVLPVQSQMKGCLLDDDGGVVRYLNPDTWRDEILDGSDGQVMVELPAYWRKFVTDGTKRQVWIAATPQEGFEFVPKMYVSAFEATIDRKENKLASVANTTTQYRGGNNNSEWDLRPNSLLGVPASNQSRTAFRTLARARKANSTEWNIYTYDIHKTLFWFFAVEYATLNTQADFIPALTHEGLHQGGLGAGVTSVTSSWWGSYNSNNPFIPCDTNISFGNNTGVTLHEVKPVVYGEDPVNVAVPSYRGVTNPFGHIWKWMDGINIRINPTEENGGNNLSEVFICSDPSMFTDVGYHYYSLIGYEARINGFVKSIIFGEGGEVIPSEVGATGITYFCDFHDTGLPTTTELRGIYFGGRAIDGTLAGLIDICNDDEPSLESTRVGTRLCFIPNILTP